MPLTAEEKRIRHAAAQKRWREKHREEYNAYMREYFKKYNEQKYPARKWTLEEDLIILEPGMRDKELASLLKRSWASVKNRKYVLRAMFKEHMA